MSSQVNERVRHASLVDLQVLDTESEAVFDGLVEVAARVCDVPISLISLIDSERQWFKANVGLDGVTETPREIAFCNHTIQLGGYLEVPDASEDSRFENNPLVTGSPNIRFYAGATLELSNGARAGTLCVIDQKPRSLSKEQRIVLTNLARAVVQLLQFKRLTGELAVSESRFKALCEASPLGIFSTDRNGLCTYSNARWQSIFGLTREHTLPENWLSELHPEDKDHVTAQWKDSLHNNNYFDLEFRVQKESDHCCSVRAIATPVYDNQGTPVGHVGAVEDISEITSQRQKLAEQHELLSVTLSSIGDAVITTNADSMITWLNPTAEKMTGWSLQHATGQPLGQVFRTVNQHTRKVTINPVDSCLARDETVKQSKDIVLISHSGEEHGIQDSAAPIRNDRGEILGAVLVFHDVTEQRRLVSEMKRRATHDHLTGLVNREEFEIQLQETLNHAVKNNSKNALLYIDLDRFKIVNDTCGHSVGDLLLIQVTKIMKNCIRSSDILARIGGDEFGVILKECSSDQAERVANLICKKIDAHKFVHSNQQFRIGSSIGLVPLDRRWDSITTALQAADSSCYIAKESGRNRVNRWLEIDQQVNIRNQDMQWVSKLQTALDNNLFSLHAQIIQNIKDNAGGLHAEVLLRLTDSDGRTIPPNVFIPAAERYHLASRIDIWVLQNAINHLKNLPDSSLIEMLCINLSGQSVGDLNFHQQAIDLISEAGEKISHQLCLEITETAAITNINDASVFIDTLRSHGVKIALDDFGAGASSFGYLKTLNVDILKIDGQFITGMLEDRLDDAAVRCFVDVAKIMGLKTVAEFVKTQEIFERTREIGIDYAQGFLLHKPEVLELVVT